LAVIGKDIEKARRILQSSDLVAIPTETVYGLAGNCFDSKAIARIFEVKNRPYFDPLIAHSTGIREVEHFVQHIPDAAYKLIENFWPGPLTLLLKKRDIIPDLVTAGLDTVAVRVPDHPLTLELLKRVNFPLAAPSANPFGYVSPTSAAHVQAQLGEKIDYILDGGLCSVGIESTIIGFDDDEKPIIYRLGGLSIEDITSIVGEVGININSSSDPLTPGMLKSHYAPLKSLIVGDLDELISNKGDKKVGVLSFMNKHAEVSDQYQCVLSEIGDVEEAATKLFSAVRYLDNTDVDEIYAELVPEKSLGRAINDRLKRASVKRT